MSYDPHDTIVAIASAAGGAARGIVRLSGPRVAECLADCFADEEDSLKAGGSAPRRLAGSMRASLRPDDAERNAPIQIHGALLFWPGERSFTRQPAAEFHTVGSPPVLAAIVDELCRHGARPAEAGEFTMRAFLAGRIDLTQAEAVLGVVDARTRDDLDGALAQLAGGLSRPLDQLREQLLSVLAEVEAGLDFPDEDLEAAARESLRANVLAAETVVAEALAQLATRDRAEDASRVVLVGPPNVGKSSLFNALVQRFGTDRRVRSIVSATPGATRDYVTARLELGGAACELVDAAGEMAEAGGELERASQLAAATQQRRAELRLRCIEATDSAPLSVAENELAVATKSDLSKMPTPAGAFGCSSLSGAGLDALADEIRRRIAGTVGGPSIGGGPPATAARCGRILRDAAEALAAARELTCRADDELLAAELRFALTAIGEAVGAVCADDVLDRVFSQFCIGK